MHEECQCVTHAQRAGDDEHLATAHASVPCIRVMESFTLYIGLNPQTLLTSVHACKPHITVGWMAHHCKLASGIAWAPGIYL